jgi:hypothetical protein
VSPVLVAVLGAFIVYLLVVGRMVTKASPMQLRAALRSSGVSGGYMVPRSFDPTGGVEQARADYVAGRLSVEEFEAAMEIALRAQEFVRSGERGVLPELERLSREQWHRRHAGPTREGSIVTLWDAKQRAKGTP